MKDFNIRLAIFLSAISFTFTSCVFVQSDRGEGYGDDDQSYVVSDQSYQDEQEEDVQFDEEQEEEVEMEPQEEMVICPLCQGNKVWQHYATGEWMTCPGCEGKGILPRSFVEESNRKVQEALEQTFGPGSSGSDMPPSPEMGGGANQSAIEAEIAQCEREIESCRQGLENSSGSITQMQYQQRIIELEHRVRQLQSQLGQ